MDFRTTFKGGLRVGSMSVGDMINSTVEDIGYF